MSEVRTRDEALAAIDGALTRWTTEAGSAIAQAMASAAAALAAAEAETARRAKRVAALRAQLAALPRTDSAQALRARLERELVQAEQSHEAARRATSRLDNVAGQVARLQRSHAKTAQASVSAARADLARRVTELSAYRAAGAGSTLTAGVIGTAGLARVLGASATSVVAAGAGSPAPPRSVGWLADHGLTDISVAAAGLADNPITGAFGRGGLTRADYRWAMTTWDQVVRPGLDRGMSRDDFASRDAARGATSRRRTVDVYDMFLGTDPVHVERRPDGTLNVLNGRHRLAVAQELGITNLPASVTDP